jgi:hypothetical protein
MSDEFDSEQHWRDERTIDLFERMMGNFPAADPVDMLAKARKAVAALEAELDKPRGDEA